MQYQIYKLRDIGGMSLVNELEVHDPRVLFTVPLSDNLQEEERYNLFFTVAKSVGSREPIERELIHFDIDNILDGSPEKIFEIAASSIGIDPKKTAAVMSGNGVQFFVLLPEPISNTKYIDERRETYAIMAEHIDKELKKAGLKGDTDVKVWDPKRVMRLPWTKNIKASKPESYARVIQGNLEPQANPLESWHKQVSEDRVPLSQFRKYPTADTEAVLAGCEYLKFCAENSKKLPEQHWFREVGITAHLPNGIAITHERSSKHPGYNNRETQAKIDRALKIGPMTCKGIQSHWNKCGTCKFFKDNLATPLMITGEDYIPSKDTGFHFQEIGANGKIKYIPDFDGLIKFYVKVSKPLKVGNRIYHWKDTQYDLQEEDALKIFAGEWFKPSPGTYEMREFEGRAMASPKVPRGGIDDLLKNIEHKVNFKNGVLSLDTMILEPHNQKYFFRGTLPFEYNPRATAPRFEQFLDEVTQGDQESILLLKEFGGYCMSGDKYWEQKALILTGTGSNGKSQFGNVLTRLVGKGNYSTVSLSKLGDGNQAVMMDGKLFNFCEEAPTHALRYSENFKKATGGEGELTGYLKYRDNYQFKNTAKIVISCNELPKSNDKTRALLRRMLVVNFNRVFEGADADKHIMDKLELELPGTFNTMMKAYIEARDRKAITLPKNSIDSLKEYQSENDGILEFAEEELIIHPHYSDKDLGVKRSDLYLSYKNYQDTNGDGRPVSRTSFLRNLSMHIKDLPKRTRVVRKGTATERVLLGIELRNKDSF